jgi:hypothetical protein
MPCISGCTVLTHKANSLKEESAENKKGPVPLYYDFGDVLIPSELKVQRQNSYVFRTPGLSAGVLSFKGRVEVNSLIIFFENNMVKDNWKPVGSFKSPRSILLYQKENRWCVISISENDFTTDVEIWVAPIIAESKVRTPK